MRTNANPPSAVDLGSVPRASESGFVGRVLRGTGAMSLGAVVTIASQLLVVPAAIAAWGAGQYGEWIVISGAVTVFQLADLGLQTYVVNSICASFARGNLEQFHETLRDALAVQTRIVLALTVGICALLWFAPIDRWLSLHTVNRLTAAVALGLLSIDLLINVPLGVVAGIYRATGRFPRAAMAGVVQRLGVLAFTIALLYFHRGFIALAVAKFCITLSAITWMSFDFRRLYPWLRLQIAGADIRRGLAMLMPGTLFLLIPAADYASTQVSLMIAQHQLSGLEVASLATHRTIFNSAQIAAGFLLSSTWPELTMLHARSDWHRLIRVHGTLTKINSFVVLLVVAGMLVASQWLYPLWTRKALHFDGVLAGLLAARALCWGYWGVSSMVLTAMNRPALIAKAAACSGVIATALAFVLIPRIGIRGAAVASLAGDLAISVWLIPRSAALMTGSTYRSFLLGPTRAAAAAVLGPALLVWLAVIDQSAAWPIRAAFLLLAAAMFSGGVMLAFDQSEKRTFGATIRRIGRLVRHRPEPVVCDSGSPE
jgi:O-antigen/teichoic acid export membrane protein